VEDINREDLEYSHNPYSGIGVVQEMHDLADAFIDSISEDDYISVKEVEPYMFYDSPDGKSVMRQVWLKVNLTLKVWKFSGEITYNVIHQEDEVVHNSEIVTHTT
jgi:hypothetical protein